MKKKQSLISAGVVAAIAVALGFVKYAQIAKAIGENAKFLPPPEAVTSAVVRSEKWPAVVESVGSLAPVRGVTLSAEESGRVSSIHFDSGARVDAGAVLVELDTSVERAKLEHARAKLLWAERSYDRTKKLRATNAVSEQGMDDSEVALKQAQADTASLEAVIARKQIVAPFAGTLGIRTVNLGQFVNPGTEIIPIQSTDSLYLNFTVPQQQGIRVSKGARVEFSVDVFPGKTFSGTITTVNPQVDPRTRAVGIQATVPNPDDGLKPGMFARLQVVLPSSGNVLVIPISAVSFASFGDSVYVVETMKRPDGSEYKGVRQQIVKIGERRGDETAVEEGLSAGQEIVSSGIFKLRPQAEVVVNNVLIPPVDSSKQPADT